MKIKTKELTKMALIAGIYVVLSLFTAPLCFGAIQIRLAEMLNLLVAVNKRYIIAVTLGCMITNCFSPLGIVDVVIGGGSTFVALFIGYHLSKNKPSLLTRMLIIGACVTLGTIAVAAELYYISHLPFCMTYGTVAAGEVLSLVLGGVILLLLKKTNHLKLLA